MHFIWTKHALKRLQERHIPKSLVDQALYTPGSTHTRPDGISEFQRTQDHKTVFVLVKTNDRGEKIVISCWINPPFPGTKDARKQTRYQQMQKSGFWKKIWLTILDQLGL